MAGGSPSQGKGRKLYIGGLMENVLKDDLVRELSKYGEIVDVWVARNPPGFAFVEYIKAADAEKAVRSLDGVTICGSRVRVEFAHGGRSKSAAGSGYRGGRSGGRGSSRRYDSPPRRSSRMSPSYDGRRHPYDVSFYPPDVANAAAAAASFPYGVSGYPPMLPFLPPEDFIRSLQSRRRSSPGNFPPMPPRGRSPGARRRSRSPIGGFGSRARDRSPPISYDGRGPGRRPEMRGRGGFGEFQRPRLSRDGRNGYSPPIAEMNGRRDDSRSRIVRDDRRRR